MLFPTYKSVTQFINQLLVHKYPFHLLKKSQHLKIAINSPFSTSQLKMTKHYSISLPYFHIFTHTFHKVTPITYYIHIFFVMGIIWTQRYCLNICYSRWTLFFSLHYILNFPILFVIMEHLILVYCYCNEGFNVLDTMKVFPHVDLIIMKKVYDFFYYVNTIINLSNVYYQRSSIFTVWSFSSCLLIIIGSL